MSGKNEKYSGFLFTEIVAAFGILGILLVGLVLSLNGFTKFNRCQLVRQRCIAAAQGQLESITATGSPIRDEEFNRLWPKLSVSIKKSGGTGQWAGMKLLEVTTSGRSFHKQVKVKLSRYILRDPILHDEAKGQPLAEEER